MRTSLGNTPVRVCVGLLVATLHLVVLILILTTPRSRPETATESRALTWVNVEMSQRTFPAVPPKEATPEPQMRTPRLSGSPEANVPSTNENAATIDPSTIRDWRRSMEAAATAAVGQALKDESYHPLGPVERAGAGSASAPAFFEPPRRKAGDIDHDAVQGRTLIWHSEHCFTELRFATIKDPNALIGAPNPPKCMLPIGKREARGDLFESMEKP
jgi:hypothetical protein